MSCYKVWQGVLTFLASKFVAHLFPGLSPIAERTVTGWKTILLRLLDLNEPVKRVHQRGAFGPDQQPSIAAVSVCVCLCLESLSHCTLCTFTLAVTWWRFLDKKLLNATNMSLTNTVIGWVSLTFTWTACWEICKYSFTTYNVNLPETKKVYLHQL